MRHIIVAASMVVVALVVTFGAASVLQFTAIAHANKSAEPFVIEASKQPVKGTGKERVTSMFRSAHNGEIVQASVRY